MRLSWPSTVGKSQFRWAKHPSSAARLTLEVLEDRVVPASTLTWSSGVTLSGATTGDTAIMEPDKSILVLGGGSTSVYKLAVGGTAWTTANPIDAARVSPAVGSIGGTELLVYGGSAGGVSLGTALIYDRANPSNIQSAAPMSTARSLLAFATDGSNRPYAIGGIDASGNRLASVERFDPTTGSWSPVASLPMVLSGASAVYDGAGNILVFGGATNSSGVTKTVLSYSVATNTWSTLAPLPSSVTEAAAVAGPDGLIYVLGGKGTDGPRTTVQTYNPATNSWTVSTPLPNPLSDEAAVVDAQARIEVIGGATSDDNPVAPLVYVTQSLANVAPLIVTTSLPAATAGAPYVATVAAIGSPAPTFTVISGPTGLGIDPNSGIISWSPTIPQIGAQSVQVQAANAVGTVTQTFTLNVTPDTTSPTVPVLSVGPITTTSDIPLSWTASTDNVAVAGYRVFLYTPAVYRGHSGRGGGITLVSPAKYTLIADNLTTTSYDVTGLSPNTTYQYAVAAFDTSNNQSGYSTVASGTTLLAPSITYYSSNSANANPTVSVVANHQLYVSVYAAGSPTPTLTLENVYVNGVATTSSGVNFTPGSITWTPDASQVGVTDIIMQATNSVGLATLDIKVTVTADVPVPSLSIDGGITYTVGNMTQTAGNPFAYQLAVNPAFNNTGTSPQYALSGTPFSFQITGTSNTSGTTYAIVSGPATMTLDPNTGIGTWAPGAADATATTSVTVSSTNSAGTSLLTFTFPTYFTNAPTNVAVGFFTSVPGTATAPVVWTPIVTWTAPVNSAGVLGAGVADYKVMVTNASTNVTTVYDTQSIATSFTLPVGITGQNWVNVTAYDANGNPSMTSNSNAPLYLAALPNLGWAASAPTAFVGQQLSVQFSSSGVTYAVASGPATATINMTTGLLSWTPTLADVGTVTIVVSAAGNGWGTMYATLSVPVVNPALALAGLPVINGGSAVINIVSASGDGTIATITTDGTPHGFWVGELVTLTGVNPGGPGGLAGTVTVTAVPLATTFQFASTYSGTETLTGATVTSALAGAQRSMVDSIVYNFTAPVNLTAAALSISVVVDNTSTGDAVGVQPTLNVAAVPFTNEWVVTFSDSVNNSVIGNSIANGAYTISINPALVTAVSDGQNLSAGETDSFYRLYGDVSGAQSVTNVDVNALNRAWGNAYYSANYKAALDYNDDGKYTNVDANAFNRAFNTRYSVMTTI